MKRAARLFLLLSSGIMLPSALMAQTAASGAESEPFFSGSFSGNVGLTTDYMFRGISQTDESPAIQGGFTYKQEMDPAVNLYAGVWSSNVDYNDNDESSIEIDYIGGMTYQLGKLSLDGGFIYYTYPGATERLNYDYWEAQLTAGYDFDVLYLQASYFYSPDYFAGSGDSHYTKLAAEFPCHSMLN